MDSTGKPILEIAAKAAITDGTGRVLIVREAATHKSNTMAGWWGLVGGRLDPGEAFFKALTREVREEVGLRVEPQRPLYVGEWWPVIHGETHQVVAVFMECKAGETTVKLSKEHDEYAWISPSERNDYRMMEPDCLVVDILAGK